MADHSEPPRHSAHERSDHIPPSPLPALAAGNRDTAVIILASATAIFLALAVALSIMLWRGRSDDMLAASARATTPAASAQPMAPAASEGVASGAQAPGA
ncbi:hypothetical protein, partial [Cryptosporangium japonicum]|uniref:hypothetical protein n=1 Tax=Cryptosporangium japonicum TaxID=80872 RepID=UPI0031D36E48